MDTLKNIHHTARELVEFYLQNESLYTEDSSQVMNALRQSALKKFAEIGVPSNKNEAYKYTNLQPLVEGDYAFLPKYVKPQVDLHEVFNCDVPRLKTHTILNVNGWFYSQNRMVGELPKGVICGSLAQVAQTNPELIEPYLGKIADAEDPISAMNSVFAKDGFFLYVPDNVTIEQPIQVINLLKAKEDTMTFQHNLVVMGKNSEAKVLWCDHTLSETKFVSNNITEVQVSDDARFDFYNVQNQHSKTVNLNGFYQNNGKGSNTNCSTVTLHGGTTRNNMQFSLLGEHSHAGVYGLTIIDGEQHADNSVFVDHAVANCTSDELFKNVLDDQSTGAFSGKIVVRPDAQKTEALQRSNNVLLSPKAVMNAKPQLVIDADDVRCSHGATIGQIDDDALFYMRQRGIDMKEARLMLMTAFTSEVLNKISIDPVRERVLTLVEQRLRGESSHCDTCAIGCEC